MTSASWNEPHRHRHRLLDLPCMQSVDCCVACGNHRNQGLDQATSPTSGFKRRLRHLFSNIHRSLKTSRFGLLVWGLVIQNPAIFFWKDPLRHNTPLLIISISAILRSPAWTMLQIWKIVKEPQNHSQKQMLNQKLTWKRTFPAFLKFVPFYLITQFVPISASRARFTGGDLTIFSMFRFSPVHIFKPSPRTCCNQFHCPCWVLSLRNFDQSCLSDFKVR